MNRSESLFDSSRRQSFVPHQTSECVQKVTTFDALSYLQEVKKAFQDQGEKYETFLDIMKQFKNQSINTKEVIARVKELLKGHNNLLIGFNIFMPKGYEIKVTEKEMPLLKKETAVDFNGAINFILKVKKRFEADDHVFKSFIRILHMSKNQKKLIEEVYQEVTALLEGHPDLLHEFTKYLPNEFVVNKRDTKVDLDVADDVDKATEPEQPEQEGNKDFSTISKP